MFVSLPGLANGPLRLPEARTAPRMRGDRARRSRRLQDSSSAPQSNKGERHFHQTQEPEHETLGGKRIDLFSPRSGLAFYLPLVALIAGVITASTLGVKRFMQRQKDLVVEFGETAVYYGNTKQNLAKIVQDYKKKLGPGVKRGQMLQSYAQFLVAERAVSVESVTDLSMVQELLGISDASAAKAFNELGVQLEKQPSLLGKLIFLVERSLPESIVSSKELLTLRASSPQDDTVISQLQRDMLTRCYRDIVERALDKDEELNEPPANEAQVLRLPEADVSAIFSAAVAQRRQASNIAEQAVREAQLGNAMKQLDVADAEDTSASASNSVQGPRAFECNSCAYTIRPAAGREWKFFGDSFKCPVCGSGKDQFSEIE
ncbi:hypothetical protein FVE85_8046 [Porphyridium purpureum]|uniref:Rubredoxin-like domain-containing protein n=1 Tax=Porphyridium purpureum TaxID=35688 RepID=A0A5J4YM88_PORPP|nr:hypothetical protein FVE85_8046 [Porphyridium purpureum]|eukprot:POR9872..scf295_9